MPLKIINQYIIRKSSRLKRELFLLFGVICSVTHQAHSRKEKDDRYNTNYNKVGNIAAELYDLHTSVNKANDA